MNISNTEYYIGQALNGLLTGRGDGTPDDMIDGIAEKAVKIGRATYAATLAAQKANETKIPDFKLG